MALPEHTMHSFIVRVWLEEEALDELEATWRGRIEHVPGSEKRYFKDLNDVVAFIKPYMEAMGIQFDDV